MTQKSGAPWDRGATSHNTRCQDSAEHRLSTRELAERVHQLDTHLRQAVRELGAHHRDLEDLRVTVAELRIELLRRRGHEHQAAAERLLARGCHD